MRPELQRIEADACDPFTDEARVLSRCETALWPPSTCEQELPGAAASHPQVIIYRLPGLFGQLEPNRAAGLLLSNARAVDGVAIGCHIVDANGDHIAAAQLAVDGQVKEGKVTRALLELEARSN